MGESCQVVPERSRPLRTHNTFLKARVSRRNLALLVACVVILSSAGAIVLLARHDSQTPIKSNITYTNHSPIMIYSDSDFDSQEFPGSGTSSDPYMISGYDIEVTDTEVAAIDIQGTTACFIVQNCYLHGVSNGIYLFTVQNGLIANNSLGENSDSGIEANSCSNIEIENNTFDFSSSGGYIGIDLSSSNDWYIANNTFLNPSQEGILSDTCSDLAIFNNSFDLIGSGGDTGISMLGADSCSITNNTCLNAINYGIYAYSSTDLVFMNNTCTDNAFGIWLDSSSGNTLSNNDFSYNARYGMALLASDNNNLFNNTCSNNLNGIRLSSSGSNTLSNNSFSYNVNYGVVLLPSSSNNILYNNTCSNNHYGISLGSSSNNNALTDNTCSDNYYSIVLSYSSSNTLSNNTWSNSQNGMRLSSSSSNTLFNNTFSNNALYGLLISDEYSTNNMIWNNTFAFNRGSTTTWDSEAVQASDDGEDNIWYTSGSTLDWGNFWSDWTTPDDDPPYGIVDSPYLIDGTAGAQDLYPQTTPLAPLTKTITGYVDDQMDTPVEGASVTVSMMDGAVDVSTKSAQTDANGLYLVSFEWLEWEPDYTIEVTAVYWESPETVTAPCDGSLTQQVDVQFLFAIPQFGSLVGFLVSIALVGVVGLVLLRRRR